MGGIGSVGAVLQLNFQDLDAFGLITHSLLHNYIGQ